MNKAQWAALNDFCEENYCTRYDVLKALKANGTVDHSTKLKELGRYADGNSYEDMYNFLGDNLI